MAPNLKTDAGVDELVVWTTTKVQGEGGTWPPLSTFRPYGLIRHYGCPKDTGEHWPKARGCPAG